MQELTDNQIEVVGGGLMSTETAMIIGIACAVFPIVGGGMLLGYYANTK